MNNDLQQKLSKLIEANFSKMESEVLVRLVSEHETLTKDLAGAKEKADQLKQERDGLREELSRKEKELSTKNNTIQDLEKKLSEKTIEFDKIKKDHVELELKCVKESKSEIFELTKIAFRHPSKIRQFDMPVVDEYTYNPTGGNSNKTNKTMPVTETISEE